MEVVGMSELSERKRRVAAEKLSFNDKREYEVVSQTSHPVHFIHKGNI
jgi:hypothetical protein